MCVFCVVCLSICLSVCMSVYMSVCLREGGEGETGEERERDLGVEIKRGRMRERAHFYSEKF